MAAPMQERGRCAGKPDRLDRADDDGVGMAVDNVFDAAIEHRQRVKQRGRACRQRRPIASRKARRALRAVAPGEAFGEILLMAAENTPSRRSAASVDVA